MIQIYTNGNVFTAAEGFGRCQAFAVENGRFVKTGTNEEVLEAFKGREKETEVTDLEGKMVVPGFNDSHIHLLNYAYSLTKLHLEGLNSVDEIVEAGIRYIREKEIPAGQWVIGCGWNHYFFPEPRFLNRHDLDRISTEHPILFTRVCEHTVTVNTRALEVLGIGRDTKDPEGGEIVRDEEGEPLGILRETARYLAYEKQPAKSVEEIKELLLRAMDEAAAVGITSVQSDDFETFSDKDWRKIVKAYKELEAEGKMKVRVYEQCLLPDLSRFQEFLDEGYRTGTGDEWFKIGPLKLLTDGSIGPRSAFLSEPYADEPKSRGIAVFTQEELNERILLAHRNGMQTACHGIGDAAMRMILTACEKAQQEEPRADARHGIVHVQFAAPDIFDRMKKGGIIGYVQPVFVQSDMHCAEERVGKERLQYAYRFNSMRKMGIHTSLSSDCPIESINPIDGIYVAVTRKDYHGFPEGGWYPEEKMSVEEAIRGYTADSAYSQFEEDRKGTIEEGKYADFAVLSHDLTKIEPDRIREVKVLMTVAGGMRTA